MRNNALVRVVQVLGFISSLALLPAAQAVQITMMVPDCPSGQALTFNPANNTLTCGIGGGGSLPIPSNCSIAANPASQSGSGLAPNTPVQLTASCASGDTPITYSWNIGVVGAVQTVAPSATTTYTVTPSNASGTGAAFSITVYIGSSTGTAPSSCSIAQVPNTAVAAVAPGTSVALTATCTGGSAVASCAWSSGIVSTSCSVNVSPSSTTSYSVVASNSSGSAPSTSTTVQVTGTTTAPNYCTGSDQIINVPWPATGQVRPQTRGFGNQKIAFAITIPFTFSPALNINHTGFMRTAEVPGSQTTFREVTVSKSPCDFQSGNYLYNGIGDADTGPSLSYTVNNPTGFRAVGASFNAQSGETVYFNIRNVFMGQPSCGSTSCDILFDFATPNRY